MSDVTCTIDGVEITVPKGTLIIRAAEQLGITIPRFCDHPLLDPVAACRQCLVEVEGQRKPATACSTPVGDGMAVKTHLTSDIARQGQEGQLELLLVNHPLDCPQCDKGGECPLQDQALAHGPGDSRMIDQKRRYIKPIPISPQVALDRERCVLCARCTRFAAEVSGDPFIELFERGALEQVAIYTDEPYSSYFSGNVVQICPVGALTAMSYRFRARPFDLRSVDGVCNHCSAGCTLRIDVRAGEIQRQLARTNMPVNEMWNCDKGRFGYEFVAHPDRLRQPTVDGEPVYWYQALEAAAQRIRDAIVAGGPRAVGVLTGGRLTDEDHFAIHRYARDVIETENVDFRMAPRTEDERPVLAAIAGTITATYEDVEHAPLVVVAGLDPEEEVPILYLRLRKSWRKNRARILMVGPTLGSLGEIAWRWVQTMPGDEADALARLPELVGDLAEADSVVVLAGERLAQSKGALPAAADLARTLGAKFAWVPRRNNARGAVDAGLVPGLLPGGRLGERDGLDTRGILEGAVSGEVKVLHLIGVDPATDFEDPALARQALDSVDTVIFQDLLPTASFPYADIVLPAAAPQERVGSFTTWEGRRQPFPQAVPPTGLALQDWDILRQLARAMGTDLGWETANDVRREAAPAMAVEEPSLDRVPKVPPSDPPVPDEQWPFAAVVVPPLIGDGDMLRGAKELLATAPPRVARIAVGDAQRLGVSDGQHIVVVAPSARLELPVVVSTGVVDGCVVLPESVGSAKVRLEGEGGGEPAARGRGSEGVA